MRSARPLIAGGDARSVARWLACAGAGRYHQKRTISVHLNHSRQARQRRQENPSRGTVTRFFETLLSSSPWVSGLFASLSWRQADDDALREALTFPAPRLMEDITLTLLSVTVAFTPLSPISNTRMPTSIQ